MSDRMFILSSAGLKNIVQNHDFNAEGEFKFIFGDHEIKMKTFFAEFISPLVSQMHQSDPTIECVEFSNKTMKSNSQFIEKMSTEIFSLFERLSQGESICINKEQSEQLQIISILIKNKELFNKLNEIFDENVEENVEENDDDNDEENIDKHIKFVTFLEENLDMNGMIEYSKSIKYIASHMYSIDKNKLNLLPMNIFYLIIKNESLKIENEDSLFDMINEFFDKEEEINQKETDTNTKLSIIDFYEEINFEYLTEDKFKELIDHLEINDLTTILWMKLKKCFYMNKNIPKENVGDRYNHVGNKIKYDGNVENAFKGIICQLTKECGGNVNEKGIVKVTASSENGSCIAKYAVDLDDCTHYFQSLNTKNSWLQYDFQSKKVHPTHYSIRTRHDGGKGSNHPKKWVIQGSNDGEKWMDLDSRENITCLNDKNAIHTFDVQMSLKNNEFYQFLRIQLTGTNTGDNDHLTLSALEYFGSIKEK